MLYRVYRQTFDLIKIYLLQDVEISTEVYQLNLSGEENNSESQDVINETNIKVRDLNVVEEQKSRSLSP